MSKDDLKDFQQLIDKSLMKFWEEILEPVLVTKADKDDLEKLATKKELQNLEGKVDSLEGKADSIERKLDAEISYRDRLEKRVIRVEDGLNLPHEL